MTDYAIVAARRLSPTGYVANFLGADTLASLAARHRGVSRHALRGAAWGATLAEFGLGAVHAAVGTGRSRAAPTEPPEHPPRPQGLAFLPPRYLERERFLAACEARNRAFPHDLGLLPHLTEITLNTAMSVPRLIGAVGGGALAGAVWTAQKLRGQAGPWRERVVPWTHVCGAAVAVAAAAAVWLTAQAGFETWRAGPLLATAVAVALGLVVGVILVGRWKIGLLQA